MSALRELVAKWLKTGAAHVAAAQAYRARGNHTEQAKHRQWVADHWLGSASDLKAALDAQDAAAPDLPNLRPASPLPWTEATSHYAEECIVDATTHAVVCDADDPKDRNYIVTACNAYPAARAELLRLRERVAELEAFARDLRDNYDCSESAHRYRREDTQCRCCMAAALLSQTT